MARDGDEASRTDGAAPRGYHHGDLRAALVAAARALISTQGVDAFRVNDAARALGVSTAAPYRHFDSREALLGAVCAAAADELSDEMRAERDRWPAGSIESLVGLGQAYVRFVCRDPELFHLMWGRVRASIDVEEARLAGARCFALLIETVEAVRGAQGLGHTPTDELALALWSGVHGLASLKLHKKLDIVVQAEPDAMVDRATRAYLAGLGLGGGSRSAEPEA